jgi:rifampin ADP-ribosylating transferase
VLQELGGRKSETMVDDPNLTDKKSPGSPTLSYRSRDPLRIVAEVAKWQGHLPEQQQQ